MSLDILLAVTAEERDFEMLTTPMIKDAYISVELQAKALDMFRENIRRNMNLFGFECEDACASAHVSIAYAVGEVEFDTACGLAEEIARDPFEVRVTGIEILEGRTTPYDYLALTVESNGCFQRAVDVVSQAVPTRGFSEGFKSHVSLLRFKKGTLNKEKARELTRRLAENGRLALMNLFNLEGSCVCVYNPKREKCVQVCFKATAATWAA